MVVFNRWKPRFWCFKTRTTTAASLPWPCSAAPWAPRRSPGTAWNAGSAKRPRQTLGDAVGRGVTKMVIDSWWFMALYGDMIWGYRCIWDITMKQRRNMVIDLTWLNHKRLWFNREKWWSSHEQWWFKHLTRIMENGHNCCKKWWLNIANVGWMGYSGV